MDATEIIPRDQRATLNLHGMDIETRATFGYLAQFAGSRNTYSAYELDLKQFHDWTRRIGVPHMLAVERTHMDLYLQFLRSRGLADATIARRFGTARGLLRYAAAEDMIGKDPTAHIKAPRIDHAKQRRTYFSTVDAAALVRAARRSPDVRDYAVITCLLYLGLRVNELCSLNVDDLHRQTGQVFIRFIGKGGGEYTMGLPIEVMLAVDGYLAGRAEGPLFLNCRGSRLDRRGVDRIIGRLSRAAGIPYKVTPHGCRRTLARTLQQHGHELGAIAQTLRHKDPRVTATCYVLDGGGVADVARQAASAIYTSMAS